MTLVVKGLMNKQVGHHLGISEITVKAHRGQVMRKMRARWFAELVTMAAKLGIGRVRERGAVAEGRGIAPAGGAGAAAANEQAYVAVTPEIHSCVTSSPI